MKAVGDFLRLFLPRDARLVLVVAPTVDRAQAMIDAFFPTGIACRACSEAALLADDAEVPYEADALVLASAAAGDGARGPALLAASRRRLRAGGLLVLPSRRPGQTIDEDAPCEAAWAHDAARRALQSAGFGSPRLHVAMASAGQSTVLLSADARASGFYLTRQGTGRSGWRGRLVARLRAWAAEAGLLWRREPRFIASARR